MHSKGLARHGEHLTRNPSPPSTDDIVAKVDRVRTILRDEYAAPHLKPWIVGFSGGKDSTLLLHFVVEMLLGLPPSKRLRHVHVLSNDTLVESPVLQSFVDASLARIADAVANLGLPVTVVKTVPDADATFWVNLIGRGYPAPNRLFRWCTDRLKIKPTTAYIRRSVADSGEAILLLGVRRQESSARAKVVKRYDNGTHLNPHNDVPGCLVFRPIVDLTTTEVWTLLLQLRPPWGGTHKGLVTLYRNAQEGECPLVTDTADAPSCGTSSARFGCWTCTVVEKDRSLRSFIDNGSEHLEPLADFRDWLKEFSRDPANRSPERRNGTDGLGPLTFAARRTVLDTLQRLETTVGTRLISDAEVRRVEQVWRDDAARDVSRRADKFLDLFGDP